MSVDIRVETSLTPEVRAAWIDLLPDDRWAFFSHPDWCEAVWTHFGPPLRLRIIVAYDESGPVGLLPVWTRRMNKWGLFLPVGECFGTRRGDYGGVVLRRDADAANVLPAILDAAVAQSGLGGTLIWPNLPCEDPSEGAFAGWCRDRGVAVETEEAHGWLVEVGGRTYDDVAAEWTSKFRNNMKRYTRNLEQDVGELGFEVLSDRDEILSSLPSFFEMHNRRWLDSGSPGTFTDPKMREFYTDLAERFAESHLNFSVLRAGGTPVAYHFGFEWAGHLLVYTITYDPGQSGAGMALQRRFIEEAAERGWQTIDLLQGDYAYKERMASRKTEMRSHFVRTARIAPGHFWLTRGRPALQRTVGGAIFKAVGRWDAIRERLKR